MFAAVRRLVRRVRRKVWPTWWWEPVRKEVLTTGGWVTVEVRSRRPFRRPGQRHLLRRADGSFTPITEGVIETCFAVDPPGRVRERFHFRAVAKDGHIVMTAAVGTACRMTWVWRPLAWCPVWLIWKRSADVWIEFEKEVGTRAEIHSFNGGTVGVSVDLLPGDTIRSAAGRLAREHRF